MTASTMLLRINPAPTPWLAENRSPQKSHDVSAANTGSKQKISEARADDITRCARNCHTSATAVDMIARNSSAPIRLSDQSKRGGSSASAAISEPIARSEDHTS